MCDIIQFDELVALRAKNPDLFQEFLLRDRHPSIEQRSLAKTAFVHEHFIGMPRTHKLLGSNIENTVVKFQNLLQKNELLNEKRLKKLKIFQQLLHSLDQFLMVDVNEGELQENINRFFRVNKLKRFSFEMEYLVDENSRNSFDCVQTLNMWLHKGLNSQPDYRSIPLSFFQLDDEIDLISLAYEVLVIHQRQYHKADFAEAYHYWRLKYGR